MKRNQSAKRLAFSPESVAAMLAGAKTITRRVITPAPAHESFKTPTVGSRWLVGPQCCAEVRCGLCHPKYAVGDRLLVAERHRFDAHPQGPVVRYPDTHATRPIPPRQDWKPSARRWNPAFLMPKWAARIELEVTAVRAERLHAITTDDVIAEGVHVPDVCYAVPEWPDVLDFERDCYATKKFASLWDQLNAKRGFAWESNPYVNVIGFRLAERQDVLRAV